MATANSNADTNTAPTQFNIPLKLNDIDLVSDPGNGERTVNTINLQAIGASQNGNISLELITGG